MLAFGKQVDKFMWNASRTQSKNVSSKLNLMQVKSSVSIFCQIARVHIAVLKMNIIYVSVWFSDFLAEQQHLISIVVSWCGEVGCVPESFLIPESNKYPIARIARQVFW